MALSLSVSNSECTVPPVSVVLDAANWSEGAIVSVTAVDDDLNDGRPYFVVQTAPASRADPNYNGLTAEDVLEEEEPIDQVSNQANGPIMSTLVYYGTFSSEDDVSDYFLFDLIAWHRVRIKRPHIADGLNCDWVLCDANLVIKGQSAQLSNHDEEIRTSILPAGRYSIQVFHFSD